MLNKILFKIFGFFEMIKDFLVTWGLKILLVLFICMILHNVVKMSEISTRYKGQYKNLVMVYEDDNKMMNMYTVGDGPKTIVILAGFGSQSPIIQYKALADGLKDEYKVVIVEYFGYGYSMSMKKNPRTNENIVNEIKKALEMYEIPGPYVLMPHSHSNIYAMYFQQAYPELVQGIVSIDGLYPAQINDKYYQEKLDTDISNINITSIFELTGFERILSYVREDIFYINEMREMPEIYGKEELSVYRNRIGSNYLSRTMVREVEKLRDNMTEMVNYKYPDYLPTLQILASDTVKQYDDAKKNLGATVDLNTLSTSLITNSMIQKIETIEGDHMMHLTNVNDLVATIKLFLVTF
ncbi:MAG: alpha/beta hydrolase [Clostridia bacterium]|nr:alpha/beta hydrolase [Clostridia bacterium]